MSWFRQIRRPLSALAFVLVAGCGQGELAGNPAAGGEGDAPGATSPNALPPLQRLPTNRLTALIDSVDHVDFVFYALDFSMSMSDPRGVRYALAHIGGEPGTRSAACQPIGRVFYQVAGRSVASAQLYFSTGCTYLEWLDAEDRPAYANALSPEGLAFFNGQFEQLIPNFTPLE